MIKITESDENMKYRNHEGLPVGPLPSVPQIDFPKSFCSKTIRQKTILHVNAT